jgi:hypothetical protein
MINNIPQKYIPTNLTKKDQNTQRKNIVKSRKMYKKQIYNVSTIKPTRKLAIETGCSKQTLEDIVDKGRAAYYSGGSRPNQTPDSWGIARLASAITGGNSSVVDYHLLHSGCKKNSKALKLATKTCRKKNKCHNYTMKKRNK